MKRSLIWICTVIAAALLSTCQAANFSAVAKVTFSAAPADGDTVTINGAVRTFRTSVTAAATEVAIGATTNLTAANYAAQLSLYPYTDLSAHLSAGTVYLIGKINVAITTASTGSWGSVTVTNVPLTNYTLILPLSSYPTTQRAFMGNLLVDAISTYPTNAISGTAPSMANFFSLAQPNIASGSNTFSGPGMFSNSNTFSGPLYANSAWTTNLTVNGPVTISAPIAAAFKMHDASGAADQKDIILSQTGGQFALTLSSDNGAVQNNVMAVSRSGASPTAITFSAPITGTIYNGGLLTNATATNMILGASKVFLNGPFSMTNSYIGFTNGSGDFPIIRARSTDAGSTPDHRTIELGMALNGVFYINEKSDDNTSATQLLQLGGSGGVSFPNGLLVAGPAEYFNSLQANGFLLAGSDGFASVASPSGSSYGFYLYGPGGDLSANPGGAFIWNNGGLKYRTDTASEGAGGLNYVHNRTSTVLGAGTDYTLTGSTAFVDFGTTDPKITLPTAGTYLIFAEESVTEDGGTANDEIRAKLRNETAATDLTGSDQAISYLPAGKVGTIKLMATVTGSASDVIAIWSHNNTSARGTVNSARTRIGYVRLY